MAWLTRRDPDRTPPPVVLAALSPDIQAAPADRLLAAARSEQTWLLATTVRFGAVHIDGSVRWLRPWHEVDSASWSREASTLTVTFVDGARPVSLPLDAQRTFLQVVRERVQASVVSVLDLPLPGPRRAKAVIRQDLATGELVEQLVIGRGTRPSPAIDEAAADAFRLLREETGLPPR